MRLTEEDEGLKDSRKGCFVFDGDGVQLATIDIPVILAVGIGNGVKVCNVRWFAYLDEAFIEHFLDPSLLRNESRDQDSADVFGRRARMGGDIDGMVERQTTDKEQISGVFGKGG